MTVFEKKNHHLILIFVLFDCPMNFSLVCAT